MKIFLRQFPLFFVALFALAAVPAVSAQTVSPIYLAKPIENVTVQAGTASTKVKLKKIFGRTGSTGDLVRFAITVGTDDVRNVDVQLLPNDAPQTVANFLSYVNTGAYTASFLHRSVPGFVVQGGGYSIVNDSVVTVTQHDPVVNEYKVSNARGTIAMAKLGNDPNSATNQWFFNLNDNASILDAQNGGFTVFGRVIGNGMDAVDAVARLPISKSGGALNELPVHDVATGQPVTTKNLVYTTVTPLSASPTKITDLSVLKVKINNSNPGLVTPTLNGNNLVLAYTAGATGSAKITLKVTDPESGSKTKAKFTVTVQ